MGPGWVETLTSLLDLSWEGYPGTHPSGKKVEFMREERRDLLDRHYEFPVNSFPTINEGLTLGEVGEVYVDLKAFNKDLNAIGRPIAVEN